MQRSGPTYICTSSNGGKSLKCVPSRQQIFSGRKEAKPRVVEASSKNPVNIYLFGDSTSDPGNFPYEPSPGNLVPFSSDIPLGPLSLKVRFNKEGRNSDGETWPYFVAQDLGYSYCKGSAITKIRRNICTLVNFALSGASQTGNTNFSPPPVGLPVPYYGSFQWEIETFRNLLDNPASTSVVSDDIFMMMNVGGNETLIAIFAILSGAVPNVPVYLAAQISNYVTGIANNIQSLYSLGMRRLFLSEIPYLASVPIFQKLEALSPGIGATVIAPFIAGMSSAMNSYIDANQTSVWPELEITRSTELPSFNNIISNPERYGIGLPVFGVFPNINSQVETGAWPVSSPYPIKNAYNLLMCDDVHFTQHTHRLYANDITKRLSPTMPMVRSNIPKSMGIVVNTSAIEEKEYMKKPNEMFASKQPVHMLSQGVNLGAVKKALANFDFMKVRDILEK